MKKLLLFLFPILLSAQFENQYYILRNQENSTNIILYDLNSQTIIEDFGDIFRVGDTQSADYLMNITGLSYFPNSPYLLVEDTFLGIRAKGNQLLNLNDFSNEGVLDTYVIGSLYYFDDLTDYGNYINSVAGGSEQTGFWVGNDDFGVVGIDFATKSSATLSGYFESFFYSKFQINLFQDDTHEFIDISPYVNLESYNQKPGLAYNRYNHSVYFMGNDSNEISSFYQVNLNTQVITELPTNMGDAPCCKYYGMHFMHGQNKIMMVDNESGDFYTYDLGNGNVEIYAETNLTNIKGIVNVQDFLGNVEVYNQGEISIYPNPVVDFLHIQSSKKIKNFELFNVLGQKISDLKMDQNRINFSSIQSGIYVLKMTMENGKVETKKIIKK